MKKAFTGVLTDAMTVFHALREVKLRGRVLRIHVVGAEPSKEGMTVKCFLAGLISLYFRDETKVTMIGPLLTNPPEIELEHDPDPALRSFGGTYQEYLGSRCYKRPDLIAAFYPGTKYSPNYVDVIHVSESSLSYFQDCMTQLTPGAKCWSTPSGRVSHSSPHATMHQTTRRPQNGWRSSRG